MNVCSLASPCGYLHIQSSFEKRQKFRSCTISEEFSENSLITIEIIIKFLGMRILRVGETDFWFVVQEFPPLGADF